MMTHFMEMVDIVCTGGVLIIKKETHIKLSYSHLGYFFSSYATKQFPYGIFSTHLHSLRDSQICESSAQCDEIHMYRLCSYSERTSESASFTCLRALYRCSSTVSPNLSVKYNTNIYEGRMT